MRITLRIRKTRGAEPRTKGVGRLSTIRFVGLDVRADTIAAAGAEPNGQVRGLGVIPNRSELIRKLVAKLGPVQQVKACYEAGPTGYVLYWQLTALGVRCEVRQFDHGEPALLEDSCAMLPNIAERTKKIAPVQDESRVVGCARFGKRYRFGLQPTTKPAIIPKTSHRT